MGCNADTHAPVAARLGYNGQLHEPTSNWQALGNGHRVFSPVLMRFYSPDALSPFHKGGFNSYAYCGDDPVNRADPNGRYTIKLMPLGLVFTGVTAALGAARGLVHAEDKETLAVLTYISIVTGLTAATIGGTYLYKKRHSKRTIQSDEGEATPATAAPQTDMAASPSGSSPRRVDFDLADPMTLPPPGSSSRYRRMSAPAAGGNGGQGASRRRTAAAQSRLQGSSPAASSAKPKRRSSVIVAGPYRPSMKKADKWAKAIRGQSSDSGNMSF